MRDDTPDYVKAAASRIAGTALGPFIMGQRNVDLEALEQRIIRQSIEEMKTIAVSVALGILRSTAITVVVEEVQEQPKAAPKKPKAQKSRAHTTKDGK